jgi:hypothetical protein
MEYVGRVKSAFSFAHLALSGKADNPRSWFYDKRRRLTRRVTRVRLDVHLVFRMWPAVCQAHSK